MGPRSRRPRCSSAASIARGSGAVPWWRSERRVARSRENGVSGGAGGSGMPWPEGPAAGGPSRELSEGPWPGGPGSVVSLWKRQSAAVQPSAAQPGAAGPAGSASPAQRRAHSSGPAASARQGAKSAPSHGPAGTSARTVVTAAPSTAPPAAPPHGSSAASAASRQGPDGAGAARQPAPGRVESSRATWPGPSWTCNSACPPRRSASARPLGPIEAGRTGISPLTVIATPARSASSARDAPTGGRQEMSRKGPMNRRWPSAVPPCAGTSGSSRSNSMALGSFALSPGFDMLFYAVSDAACHAAQGGSDKVQPPGRDICRRVRDE